MRIPALALALVLLAPSAGALVSVPIPWIDVRLSVQEYARPGATFIIPGWVGLGGVVTNVGLPQTNVTLNVYQSGPGGLVSNATSDIEGNFVFRERLHAKGSYWVSAFAVKGFSSSDTHRLTIADPPGAPSALIAAAGPGAREVTIAWSHPLDNGGAPVSAYTHEVIGHTIGQSEGNARTAIHGSLVPGQTYAIRVTAHNGVGAGGTASLTFTAPE